MLTAIIVDDEIKKAHYLKKMLDDNIGDVILKGMATDSDEAIKLIVNEKPDLVFLDIELQTSTGFDLLSRIPEINFSVIFTTAHQHYALTAIKFAALDFLLKPIDKDELMTAVNRAIKQHAGNMANKNIEVLIHNLSKKNEPKKIAISTNTGIIVMEMKDILYCKADGPYTHIFYQDTVLLSSTHLKEFENLLTEHNFFRLHKSYLVNLAAIKKYKKSEDAFVIVSNGDRVDVSDRKKEELMKKLSSQIIFVQ